MKYSSLRLCFPLVLAGDFPPLSRGIYVASGRKTRAREKARNPWRSGSLTFNFPNRFSDNQKGKSEGSLPDPGFIPSPWNWKATVAFCPWSTQPIEASICLRIFWDPVKVTHVAPSANTMVWGVHSKHQPWKRVEGFDPQETKVGKENPRWNIWEDRPWETPLHSLTSWIGAGQDGGHWPPVTSQYWTHSKRPRNWISVAVRGQWLLYWTEQL